MESQVIPIGNEKVTTSPHCLVCGKGLNCSLLTLCKGCETPTHPDCWEYQGGCAMFGCGCTVGKPYHQPSPQQSSNAVLIIPVNEDNLSMKAPWEERDPWAELAVLLSGTKYIQTLEARMGLGPDEYRKWKGHFEGRINRTLSPERLLPPTYDRPDRFTCPGAINYLTYWLGIVEGWIDQDGLGNRRSSRYNGIDKNSEYRRLSDFVDDLCNAFEIEPIPHHASIGNYLRHNYWRRLTGASTFESGWILAVILFGCGAFVTGAAAALVGTTGGGAVFTNPGKTEFLKYRMSVEEIIIPKLRVLSEP